jgi:O-antigen ligase
MKQIYNTAGYVNIIIISLMIILLPCVVNPALFETVNAAKTFGFFAFLLILVCFFLIVVFLNPENGIRFSPLDLGLLIWFVYLIIKFFTGHYPLTLPQFEFLGLAILFLVLRFLPVEYFWWLLASFLISALIQAVYGNLQLWGFLPSNHHLFKITGGFINPGPYSGYLAVVFPAALGIWLVRRGFLPLTFPGRFGKLLSSIQHPLPWLAIIAMICLIMVLPSAQSRAAWLAIAVSSIYLLWKLDIIKSFLERQRLSPFAKTILPLLVAGVIISGSVGLYHFKKDSADGRLFIYRNTLSMVADKPITGHGYGGFNAQYMNYQAAFFANNPDAPQALNAGGGGYAFNEYLKHATEFGMAGLILMLAVIAIAFMSKPGAAKNPNQAVSDHAKLEMLISRAMLISVCVFALASYPGKVLPVKIALVFSLASLARCTRVWQPGCRVPTAGLWLIKAIVVLVFVPALFFLPGFLKTSKQAQKDWLSAYRFYQLGAYPQAINIFEKAYPVLHYNGNFLTNYGKALSMAGLHYEAIEIMQKAAWTQPGTVAYTALGDSYKATNQYEEAEKAYAHASNMIPSRLYPKYLLAKLFEETEQNEKARQTAENILTSNAKIESTAVNQIRQEMQDLIKRLDVKTTNYYNE